MIEIQLFPMRNLPGGSATICGRNDGEPDFYDIVVRDDDEDDPIEEFDDMTLEQATAKMVELEKKYPDADVDCGEYL